MRHLIVSIAAVALIAAACGSDGEDALESADGSASETSEETEDGATTDADDPVSGDTDSDWCVAARSAAESGESPLDLSLVDVDPAAIETRFTESLAVIEEWEDRAPPEIDGQVTTVAESFRALVAMADAADWDLMAIGTDPTFLATFDAPDLEAAANDIDRYTTDVCGIDLGVGLDAGPVADPSVPGPGDGDLATEFLGKFGLPADFLTDEQLVCVTGELERAYPDGIPGELIIDEETGALFTTAAETCGFAAP